MSTSRDPDPTPIAQRIAWVIDSPLTSPWLKSTLRSALEEDPISAANDALILSNLLHSRADDWFQRQVERFSRR